MDSKDKILELIKNKPKHYSVLVKKDPILSEWVKEHSLICSENYIEMIYSALKQETNICKYGNIKYISRLAEGWVCCRPSKYM